MRMTAPARVRALDPAEVVLGERIFRSWVLLFGVIPIDYDDLTLIALEPGRGFHERSRMLSMRVWEHERTLEPDGEAAARVRDRLSFEPRLPGSGPLLERHRPRDLPAPPPAATPAVRLAGRAAACRCGLRGRRSTAWIAFGTLNGSRRSRHQARSSLAVDRLAQHDERGHRLAPLGIGQARHAGVGDRRVAEQRLLDLERRDVLAAA